MTDPLTPDDIARWRELHEKATPGPWTTGTYDSSGYRDVIWPEDKGVICSAWSDHATLIAEYRTAVPRLLDEIERLKVAVREKEMVRYSIEQTARAAIAHANKLEREITDCSGSCRLPDYD